MKISVSIETKDRRLAGHKNYLGETLRNLARTDFFSHPSLHSIRIVSGGELPDFFDTEVAPIVDLIPSDKDVEYFVCPESGCTRQQNGQRAIRFAAEPTDADWVVKLEDDLDFVDTFMASLTAWLNDYGEAQVPMFSLGATFEFVSKSKYATEDESVLGPGESFPYVRAALARGDAIIPHKIGGYWGAQALVWKRDLAAHLANWLGPDPFLFDGKAEHRHRGHDLLLQVWAASIGAKAFGVAVPAFVQHIGRQSNLDQPEIGHVQPFFQFPWPGRSWQYHQRRP